MKRTRTIYHVCSFVAVIFFLTLASTGAQASKPSAGAFDGAAFYKGKTVTLYSGPAGSGVDVVSRLFARHFSELTGARVLVENKAELGGLEAFNQGYAARPDGLTMACMMGDSGHINHILREPIARYDVTKFISIGSNPLSKYVVYSLAGGPYNTVEKIQAAKGLMGAGGGNRSGNTVWAAGGAYLLGLENFKIILGFGGPPQSKLAVLQREAAFCGFQAHTPALLPDLVPLVTLDFERQPIFPDVPALPEVVVMTPEKEAVLTLAAMTAGMGPWYVFPPGVKPEIVAYVRGAFVEIMSRPDVIAEGKKVLNAFGHASGEEVEMISARMMDLQDELRDFMKLVDASFR